MPPTPTDSFTPSYSDQREFTTGSGAASYPNDPNFIQPVAALDAPLSPAAAARFRDAKRKALQDQIRKRQAAAKAARAQREADRLKRADAYKKARQQLRDRIAAETQGSLPSTTPTVAPSSASPSRALPSASLAAALLAGRSLRNMLGTGLTGQPGPIPTSGLVTGDTQMQYLARQRLTQ